MTDAFTAEPERPGDPPRLAIVEPFKLNVTVSLPPGGGFSRPTDHHVGMGNVVENDHSGSLEIIDRHGVKIATYARGHWISFKITYYEVPGDHEIREDDRKRRSWAV